ncbi:hypothetical protein pb186bvf_001086 [Paramecium bursaria]
MQDEQLDGFYQNFLKFYQTAKEITNVRFSYMKELYNLGVDVFPDNQEIFNIQQNNRLSSQAFQTKLKKNWTDDDKKVLIWLVGKVMAMNRRDLKQISDTDWNHIASMMQRRDSFQCKQKWLQMMKLPLQQAPWSPTEDELLKKIIDDFQSMNRGNKWSMIATQLNKQSDTNVHRNGKQCRERWNNHLNPSINRTPWTSMEDLDLMKQALQNGKKWALISKKLNVPRSENSVKNRFNCLLRKEKNSKQKQLNFDYLRKEDLSGDEDDSKMSNFPSSAEELNHTDIRHIQNIIKKLEWRIQQDGQAKEDQDQDIKQEYQEPKKVKMENFVPTHRKLRNQSQEQVSFQLKDTAGIQDEELMQLQPCLVNKEKNFIYFVQTDLLQQYIQKQQECQMPQNQQFTENLSNPNSLGSYYQFYDPKMLRSTQYLLSNNGQQPDMAQNLFSIPTLNNYNYQRSQINIPPSMNNYQPTLSANLSASLQNLQQSFSSGAMQNPFANYPSGTNLLMPNMYMRQNH